MWRTIPQHSKILDLQERMWQKTVLFVCGYILYIYISVPEPIMSVCVFKEEKQHFIHVHQFYERCHIIHTVSSFFSLLWAHFTKVCIIYNKTKHQDQELHELRINNVDAWWVLVLSGMFGLTIPPLIIRIWFHLNKVRPLDTVASSESHHNRLQLSQPFYPVCTNS